MKGIAETAGRTPVAKENESEKTLLKTAFLSYYISMYNSVIDQIGFKQGSITTDEIYDFMQDLKHEAGEYVPNIEKEDIIFSLDVLRFLGICKEANS
jgi:hypothetical protein